ncbi:MAG: ABC transporter substrate-binding protein [Phototrophicaceae bacterium]
MSRNKFIALLLLTVLVMTSVSSVFAQDDFTAALESITGEGIVCPEGEAEITFASGAVGLETEVNRALADFFQETCPNVTVTFSQNPESATEILNLYLQLWEAQSADVDVFQVDVIWPAIIAPHVVDMNEYLDEETIGGIFADMIAGQTVDGRLVAIPWFSDAAGLYYRTDLLEKYGVEVPTTWAELEEAAAIIQEGEVAEGNAEFAGYVWQGNDYEGLTCDAHEWVVSTTGDSFITAEGEVNVTDPAFAALLESAVGWVGGISPEGVTTYQEEESRNAFQSGNAAFMRNWPYAFPLGNSEDSAVAGKFGWVPLPTGGVRSGACLGGWQVAVSAYSDNVEASVEFAKFMTSFEVQRLRALVQGLLPSRPAVYEDPEVAANALFAAAGPILGTAYPRPSVITGDRYGEASAIFSGGIHKILTGEVAVADGLAELDAALADFMAATE